MSPQIASPVAWVLVSRNCTVSLAASPCPSQPTSQIFSYFYNLAFLLFHFLNPNTGKQKYDTFQMAYSHIERTPEVWMWKSRGVGGFWHSLTFMYRCGNLWEGIVFPLCVGGCGVRATQSGDGGEVATQVTSLTDSNIQEGKFTSKSFHSK